MCVLDKAPNHLIVTLTCRGIDEEIDVICVGEVEKEGGCIFLGEGSSH